MLFEKIQLESDEHIIKIVHKHWFIFFKHGFGIGMTALFPLVGWILVGYFTQNSTSIVSIDTSVYTKYFIFFYSFWLLFNWMTLAHMWTTHHLDVWVLTDRRIIAIDQTSLFGRKIGSFRLEKLQDVNIYIDGIVATLLHYGVVEAETASGSDDEFKMTHLPNPRDLKADILKAADTRMKKQTQAYTDQTSL